MSGTSLGKYRLNYALVAVVTGLSYYSVVNGLWSVVVVVSVVILMLGL